MRYQLRYASKRPQMYDVNSRIQKAKRIIKTLEYHLGEKKLKNLNCLDLGASTGIIDNYLADCFKQVIGTDIDREAIIFAKKEFRKKNLFFKIEDAMNLSFKSNSFDIVICTHVYEHVLDSGKLFNEIYRVLKPEGLCYLAAMNSLWPFEPHYNLLFLSWLPKSLGNLYVKLYGRAGSYYENPLNYWQLKKITSEFESEELTEKILKDPNRYGYDDIIKKSVLPLSKLLSFASKYLAPTFFWLLKKPFLQKGTFCISFDTELLWGRWDLNYIPFIKRAKRERKIIERLLELLDQYKIPATWAVVGKLFEMPPKNRKNKDLWYAPDIIKMIKKYPSQEIASHSYSHLYFNKLSRKKAKEEIKKSMSVASRQNIYLKSFVFPRNAIEHLDLLKSAGITSFRGPDYVWFNTFKKYLHSFAKVLEFLDIFLAIPHSSRIFIEDGIVNIPGTMYFVSSRWPRNLMPKNTRFRAAKSGLSKAIEKKQLFHLWTHPTDFVDNEDKMLEEFESILKYASQLRKEGKIEVKTMKEVASELRF